MPSKLVLFVLGAVLLLSSSGPVWAAESQISLKFELQSSCSLEPDERQYLQKGARQIQRVYGNLGYPMTIPEPLSIHFFCQKRAYQKFHKKTHGGSMRQSAYYSRKHGLVAIYAQRGMDKALPIVFHESSHALIHQLGEHYPKWLNEGLAEYFEGAKPQASGLLVQPQRQKAERLRNWLQSSELPSLQALFALRPGDWDDWNAEDLRASSMAWGLIYFLMEGPQRQQVVSALLNPEPRFTYYDDLLNYAYPGGLKKLDKDWRVWLQAEPKAQFWALEIRP